MTGLWIHIFQVSLSSSMVLLPMLLLKKRLMSRYRPKSCYLLWLCLCLRLLVPVWLPLPMSAVEISLPAGVVSSPASPAFQPATASGSAPIFTHALSPVDWTGILWAAGAVCVLLWHVLLYFRLRGHIMRHAIYLSGNLYETSGLASSVPVFQSVWDTPMTLGLLHPVIVLPQNTPAEDLPMILRHELCHLHHGDLWCKALFLLCCSVHWFNPLVWMLGSAAGESMELCCDEAVVSGHNATFRQNYGQVLLRSAAGHNSRLSTSFASGNLKGRIMNLFQTNKKSGFTLVSLSLCATILVCSLLTVSAADEQAPTDSAKATQPITQQEVLTGITQQNTAPTDLWIWPLAQDYQLSTTYGSRVHPVTGKTITHPGIDIVASSGTPVYCVQSGTVKEAGFDLTLGNCVLVDHGSDRFTLYAHMKTTLVSAGDQVAQGHQLGEVGKTGQATGPHLHFEVRNTQAQTSDPLSFFPDTPVIYPTP